MQKVLKIVALLIVNTVMYFVFQMIASFVQFALFGSGNTSERYSSEVSLFFIVL